jgi:hypothetical protein
MSEMMIYHEDVEQIQLNCFDPHGKRGIGYGQQEYFEDSGPINIVKVGQSEPTRRKNEAEIQ